MASLNFLTTIMAIGYAGLMILPLSPLSIFYEKKIYPSYFVFASFCSFSVSVPITVPITVPNMVQILVLISVPIWDFGSDFGSDFSSDVSADVGFPILVLILVPISISVLLNQLIVELCASPSDNLISLSYLMPVFSANLFGLLCHRLLDKLCTWIESK